MRDEEIEEVGFEHEDDDLAIAPELETMDDVIAKVNGIIQGCTESFMLTQVATLTVKRSNGQYSKVAHVGGEDFKLIRVYAVKREQLIYVFKPVMASDYEEMEMMESLAQASLQGFGDYLNTIISSDILQIRQEVKKAKSDLAEKKRN
jgi:hypothetical protein